MTPRKLRKTLQAGYTLVEMTIVVAFFAMLSLTIISQFKATITLNAKANALQETALKLGKAWMYVTVNCGTGYQIETTPLGATPTNAANNVSFLLGNRAVNPAFASCYKVSGSKPLYGMSTGPAGGELILKHAISVATEPGGGRALAISYANVPEEVVRVLYSKYSTVTGAATATSLPTNDTTNNKFRFSSATNGVRTVTLVVPI